jgi:nucleotide-binding universal stress UspA family protein
MRIRDIVVHVDATPAVSARIGLACGLARRHGAKLLGLFTHAGKTTLGLAPAHQPALLGQGARVAEAAFRRIAEPFAIETGWIVETAAAESAVARGVIVQAREADLTVLGQQDPRETDSGVPVDLIEQTVSHAGRPVLVVPYAGQFQGVGRRVVIAWNGSREAARALADALPLIDGAEAVSVLSLRAKAAGRLTAAAPLEGIVAHLARHGLPATPDRLVFEANTIEAAERLLSHLADAGADLLVLGAAGRGRAAPSAKRSLTTGILARMTIPVLLSY